MSRADRRPTVSPVEAPPATADAPPAPGGARSIRVLYLGGNVIQVRGTYSGQAYAFSPRERVRRVDAADARVLLRTRFFRRADEP